MLCICLRGGEAVSEAERRETSFCLSKQSLRTYHVSQGTGLEY
jgi:hypothetical protein